MLAIVVAACVEYDPRGEPLVPELPRTLVYDTFVQPRGQSVDVVVFADTSDSMAEELATLGETIAPFVARLADVVPDWQLAAVTGDSGCAVGGVLTPEDADHAERFAAAIVTPTASNAFQEMGLLAVTRAVEGPEGCNAGLVRGDLLLVVVVSDEHDQSPGFDQDADYWASYLDRMAAVHGNPLGIVVSAVAGPVPGGCVTDERRADPGEGYDRASAATGGLFLSICDDWAADLSRLIDVGAAPRDVFVLSRTPVEETIEVRVDEQPVSDWVYVPVSGAVWLPEAPGPGRRVDIAYTPAP